MTFWSWNGYKVQKGLALGTFKVIGCNFHSQFTLRKVMVLSAFKTWAFISKWGKGIRSKNNLIYNEFSSKMGGKRKTKKKIFAHLIWNGRLAWVVPCCCTHYHLRQVCDILQEKCSRKKCKKYIASIKLIIHMIEFFFLLEIISFDEFWVI